MDRFPARTGGKRARLDALQAGGAGLRRRLAAPRTTWRSWAMFALAVAPALAAAEVFEPARLEKRAVVTGCVDPIQMTVLGNGRLIFIERSGTVRLVREPTQPAPAVETVGQIPVAVFGEVGLLGIAADNACDETGWVYLFFCPQAKPDTLRLSRFTIRDERLILDSEATLLEYPIDTAGAIHMGGGLCMDAKGDLWLGTGDNCPPIPELPVDARPGRENFDALRSSANSQDLRGKILRIRPQPDGTYAIPAGNLFTDERQGRPEIYAMGCRNPFRLTVDPATGAVLWGDVGPNIAGTLGLGPDGYDEFNRTTEPGNFGWPMFVGPNEAYRTFDFATRQAGELFAVEQPTNPSPNNTGLRELPAPKPALIWYPSTASERFPTLGSGGRSAMAGPIYRYRPTDPLGPHLPDHYQGRWFIFDWTRNWIQTVEFDAGGTVARIEPFMPDTLFRKPIDMKVGVDGSLFVIEFGDKWGDNRDAEISRIVYRRGNRPPLARLTASPAAGREPLHVRLDASASVDPDGDPLAFEWEVSGRTLESREPSVAVTLAERGPQRVRVTVADPARTTDRRELTIQVGNEPPQVTIRAPLHGSFFDWGQTIHYRVDVDDLEDNATHRGAIPAARVMTSLEPLTRRGRDAALDPGLALMRRTTCFSCHTTRAASAGPAYEAIARKYHAAGDETLRQLAVKIVSGGAGVWGDKPMPPHPQHTVDEARQMVRWVLSLANQTTTQYQAGRHGFFPATAPVGSEPSVVELVAQYTDDGVGAGDGSRSAAVAAPAAAAGSTIPALRGEDRIVLHARRKRAAFADRFHAARTVDVFEGGVGLVVRLEPRGWLAMDDLRLEDIDRVTVWLDHRSTRSGRLTLRQHAPDGRVLAELSLPSGTGEVADDYRPVTLALAPTSGLSTLFLVYEPPQDGREAGAGGELSLSWIEFHESAETRQRKAAARAARKRILLIPTQLDHSWGTHMYTDVCRLLATTLNQTPGVEATVCPDLDWPKDQALVDDVDGVVFYSRPAGDLLLSPRHREQAERLLQRGVGLTAIHWATGAEEEVGAMYKSILGGWFNFAFSSLAVDRLPLEQVDPRHPVCRGWEGYLLRDEFYLNLRFHPDAIPLAKVRVKGQDQTVAWVHERQGGGRSFGTTLGHFHDNFADPRFRRMLVNGILWTTGLEIPEGGLAVEIPEQLLQLEQPPAPQPARGWTYDRLREALARLDAGAAPPPSFENGRHLFQTASCATCHVLTSPDAGKVAADEELEAPRLGPDLTRIRVKMAEADDPTGALLRAIVEPSASIDERYRTEILQLEDGTVINGLVKDERDGHVFVAINPAEPNQLRRVALDEIEARRKTDVSWMPAGLLDALDETQVRDLVAYVEAGGNPNSSAYRTPTIPRETWADPGLPVQAGLRLWLDASRINAGRSALGLPELVDGAAVGLWPDASGRKTHAGQRRLDSQPLFRATPRGNWLEFDGVDDSVTATPRYLKTPGFTALMVVAPEHNRGWPGLLSGNALGRDDFRTGFALDLMPEPTESWRTMMSEGPGYQGVVNLMREDHAWGQFLIVTLRSAPGAEGLALRINGRPQRTRERPAEPIQIDELTVGARYWSHDPHLPPFTRGFLRGRVAQVLVYDRPLTDDELVANEVAMWQRNEGLLDPSR